MAIDTSGMLEAMPSVGNTKSICESLPLRRFYILISGAYFSAVKTTPDFFNRIGRFLPS
jgi:hypothetical protein